jgi:glutathione synthase/RimK-type ligase-like ATP-grasp enzyme
MKLGIHHSKGSFSERWIEYCKSRNIDFKLVDCYKSDIFLQLNDCDALMWHFHQNSASAMLFARQLLYAVEMSGKKVFPDFYSMWHFDDKVGQKYLLESIEAPMPETWVFYDKKEALSWSKEAVYPLVFKLRCGAGSQNVQLVRNKRNAVKLIEKAFTSGFPKYNPVNSLKERWRRFMLGKTNIQDVFRGIARFIIPPSYSKGHDREKGYVYFQEFIPDNDHDIRVVVIKARAFAIKRVIRKNDFRASGSGNILYSKDLFDENTLKLSFNLAQKLKSQCVAFDYVYKNGNPLVVEISYGFSPEGYDSCPGYWDSNLNWHEGKFNPYGWMVENVILSCQ